MVSEVVAETIKPLASGGAASADLAALEQALAKVSEAREAQAAGQRGLQSAVRRAADSWAEQSSLAVTTMLQKELSKISDGVAVTLAQQLSQSKRFCEALAKGVQRITPPRAPGPLRRPPRGAGHPARPGRMHGAGPCGCGTFGAAGAGAGGEQASFAPTSFGPAGPACFGPLGGAGGLGGLGGLGSFGSAGMGGVGMFGAMGGCGGMGLGFGGLGCAAGAGVCGSEAAFLGALQASGAGGGRLTLLLPRGLVGGVLVPRGLMAEIAQRSGCRIDIGGEGPAETMQVSLTGSFAANSLAALLLQERAVQFQQEQP
ncbi:unnamed protein product [Prorocentrum cordatum]|uniref:Uncharacterized protein n=1 Tax=Prorocentrum cordatum TaxID=2364126 RepID=A0ABN9TPP3_9DINO|nr:unnamed protein product [Polarella glacialis]